MKKSNLRTFLIILLVFVIPCPVYADYGSIQIDGYYDDWEDKPHTEVYNGKNPPDGKVNYVSLFRDEENLYVHIIYAEKNNQDINNMIIDLRTNLGKEWYWTAEDIFSDNVDASYNVEQGSDSQTDNSDDKNDNNTNGNGSDTTDQSSNTGNGNGNGNSSNTTEQSGNNGNGNGSDSTEQNGNNQTDNGSGTPDPNANSDQGQDTPDPNTNPDQGQDTPDPNANPDQGQDTPDPNVNPEQPGDEPGNTDPNINPDQPENGEEPTPGGIVEPGSEDILPPTDVATDPAIDMLDPEFPWDLIPGDYGTWSFTVYQSMDPVGEGYFTRSEGNSDEAEFCIPLSTITDEYDGISDITMKIKKLGKQSIVCVGASTAPYIGVAIGAAVVLASFAGYHYKRRRPLSLKKG